MTTETAQDVLHRVQRHASTRAVALVSSTPSIRSHAGHASAYGCRYRVTGHPP
ncbi:MAG: hypothetical protein ACRDTH_29275 [Pseudonocardiaceae bacterium]